MSSNETIICFLCETTVLKKNLKAHYSRRHPGEELKWKSATSNDVRNFFSGNPQQEKRKGPEMDYHEIGSTYIGNKRSRIEDLSDISTVHSNKRDDSPSSTDLHQILEAVKSKKYFYTFPFFIFDFYYFLDFLLTKVKRFQRIRSFFFFRRMFGCVFLVNSPFFPPFLCYFFFLNPSFAISREHVCSFP